MNYGTKLVINIDLNQKNHFIYSIFKIHFKLIRIFMSRKNLPHS